MSLSISQIKSRLNQAKKAYYTGKPIMTDMEYDQLEEKYIEMGGKPNIGYYSQDAIKLPFWMGSQDKIKPNTGKVDRFCNLLQDSGTQKACISTKLDGISGLYYQNRLYTRGDGVNGHDISYIIPFVDLPHLEDKYAVRGEFLISLENFENDMWLEFKNPRNTVAGIINRKWSTLNKQPELLDRLKYVDFVAYELYIPGLDKQLPPSRQYTKLKSLGFKVVENIIVDIHQVCDDELTSIHDERRKKSKYEMDGLIIQGDIEYIRNNSGNPSYARAFKVESETRETEVLGISWEITRTGIVVPVVQVKPVVLDGVTIKNVTGHNARRVVELGIGPGAIVRIIRSGQVIPHIQMASVQVEPVLPLDKYVWDENGVNLIVNGYDNTGKMEILSNLHFLKTIGVKCIGEKVVETLYKNSGLETPYDFCHIMEHIEELSKIDGIGVRQLTKIGENIQNAIEFASIGTLIVSLEIFGKGVGPRKIEKLLAIKQDLIIQVLEAIDGDSDLPPLDMFVTNVSGIPGFASRTASQMWYNCQSADWNRIRPFIDIIYDKITDNTNSDDESQDISNIDLSGVKFYLTGVRNPKLVTDMEKMGAKQSSSAFNLLIVKDRNVSNSKVVKAKTKNIPIITESDAIEKYINLTRI